MKNAFGFALMVALFTLASQTAQAECDIQNTSGCFPYREPSQKIGTNLLFS